MSLCDEGKSDYPTISKLIESILAINENYLVTIKYDVLFAEVPVSAKDMKKKSLFSE